MTHKNAPLTIEGRRRLVERCRSRPIAHVAAEMGISRACASKWVNRWRRHGELGLLDRSSAPHHSPTATPPTVVGQIETWRRERKWSAQRITHELAGQGIPLNRRTVSRHLKRLRLNRRKFLDPGGDNNRKPGKVTARWPDHMVHLDVKKVGRIPDGGGWRIHGRGSDQAKTIDRAKSAGAKRGYTYRHSAVDGFSRLSYTEPLADEKGATAAEFLARAKIWFAAHGITHFHRIVTDNGACYRSGDFARIVGERTPQRKGGALPANTGRGTTLCPRIQQRRGPVFPDRCLEHPLQLPPPAQRTWRMAASISTSRRRHERPALIQLGAVKRLSTYPHCDRAGA